MTFWCRKCFSNISSVIFLHGEVFLYFNLGGIYPWLHLHKGRYTLGLHGVLPYIFMVNTFIVIFWVNSDCVDRSKAFYYASPKLSMDPQLNGEVYQWWYIYFDGFVSFQGNPTISRHGNGNAPWWHGLSTCVWLVHVCPTHSGTLDSFGTIFRSLVYIRLHARHSFALTYSYIGHM